NSLPFEPWITPDSRRKLHELDANSLPMCSELAPRNADLLRDVDPSIDPLRAQSTFVPGDVKQLTIGVSLVLFKRADEWIGSPVSSVVGTPRTLDSVSHPPIPIRSA